MNKRNIHDFFLYLVVGGIATLVEWGLFYCFNHVFSWYYFVSTILAYVLSTFANWLAGRILLFKKTEKGLFYEIGGIYAASIIGLLLNLAIMWIMVDALKINSMISKIIATGLVFIWNYVIRKMVIYKGENG